MRLLVIFFILTMIIGVTGCVESSDINKSNIDLSNVNESKGIYDNANRLYEDYKWKLNLVTEIQNRTDALGTDATKENYIEWKLRNNETIESGERLATYITEHRDVLNQYWTSDILVLIAKNKVTSERDNQNIEQIINSFENPNKKFLWQISFYGNENGRDVGAITFQNTGKNLSNVKFIFLLLTNSGNLYDSESVLLGDVAQGKTITKKVSMPSRYWGQETWSQMNLSIYVNGVVEEKWVFRDDEWIEQ
jgi:hypothetical protein